MHWLLAGCGRLGLRVADLLLQGGHRVTGLRRHWPAAGIPIGLQRCTVDLHDGSALAASVPPDVDGIIHVLTPDERSPEGYRRAYQSSLQRLLDLPQLALDKQRWLFVSSTAVYGDADGAELDETADSAPAGFNGQILLQAEDCLRQARANAVCLRLGGIYGPGRTQLLRGLLAGTARVQRAPPHWTNRVHAEDAARMLAWLVERPDTGIVNGVDGDAVSEADLADWLCAELDSPPPAERAADGRANRRILPRRLQQAGFQWRYPDHRIGYSELIASLRQDARPPP